MYAQWFCIFHVSQAKGGVEGVAQESYKLRILDVCVVAKYDWSRIDQLDISHSPRSK